MAGSKIAFDWTIDSLRICLTSPSPLCLWQRGTAGGVCVGSNLISHYSGGSSRGIAHNKVSDACSVLSIVAALCLAGCRRPGPQPNRRRRRAICREFMFYRRRSALRTLRTRAFAQRAMANIDGITQVCPELHTWKVSCYETSFCQSVTNNMCYTTREYAVLEFFCKLQFAENLCKIMPLPLNHPFVMSQRVTDTILLSLPPQ